MEQARNDDWQTHELALAIHRLTANLLRIMADGGRAFDLQKQLDEANKLAKQVGGRLADSTMQDALQLSWPWLESKTDDAHRFNEEKSLIRFIVQYSLRLAAANLEGNNSLKSQNEHLLRDFIRRYEEERKALMIREVH